MKISFDGIDTLLRLWRKGSRFLIIALIVICIVQTAHPDIIFNSLLSYTSMHYIVNVSETVLHVCSVALIFLSIFFWVVLILKTVIKRVNEGEKGDFMHDAFLMAPRFFRPAFDLMLVSMMLLYLLNKNILLDVLFRAYSPISFINLFFVFLISAFPFFLALITLFADGPVE